MNVSPPPFPVRKNGMHFCIWMAFFRDFTVPFCPTNSVGHAPRGLALRPTLSRAILKLLYAYANRSFTYISTFFLSLCPLHLLSYASALLLILARSFTLHSPFSRLLRQAGVTVAVFYSPRATGGPPGMIPQAFTW